MVITKRKKGGKPKQREQRRNPWTGVGISGETHPFPDQ